MKNNHSLAALAIMATLFCLPTSAQDLKLKGIGHNNRYDDGEQMVTSYLGWNPELGKAIFIVDNGIYAMNYDGTSLSTPVKEPAVVASDIKGDNEKEIWANNFNMMYGNSGAVYVDGQLVTVYSRDESSTVDEELFRVCKWNAKTGDLLSSEIRPKSDHLESAGMSYNSKDGKVYGLFYLTGQDLPDEITSDPDYFEDQDADMTDGDAGYCLCTIDLQTMKVTPITPGLYYYNFVTFAINSNGRAFALTSGGSNGVINDEGKMTDIDGNLTGAQLFEFDLSTGLMKTKVVSYIDENGEKQFEKVSVYEHGTGYSSQYKRQSACFSKSNPNIMYWNGFYNSGKGINEWGSWSSLSDKEWRTNGKYDTSLYAVDITTGEATRLANIDNRWAFSALWIDGDDASDGAGIDITAEPTKEAYIALSTADNGAIWQQVEIGQQYTYRLEPAIGWKVHGVTFNNQDITSQVTEKGTITTPVINSEFSTLFVTFEEDNTGVQDLKGQASEVRILGKKGGISVQNAKAGDVLLVYSIDGRLLLTHELTSGQAEIALDSKKLYIIKVADKVVKARL